MQDENTGTNAKEESPGGYVEVKDAKPFKRLCVNVNIRFTENHYLASFNHAPPRVFHNMPELLTAIEVECEKLK